MSSFKKIKSKLMMESHLNDDLTALVDLLFKHKSFLFLNTNNSDIYKNLVDLDIIKYNSNGVYINVNDYLAYGFIINQEPMLTDKSSDISHVLSFEKILEDNFSHDRDLKSFELTQQIRKLWFKSANIDNKSNLLYTKKVDNSDVKNCLYDVFCDIFNELTLTHIDIYKHIQQYIKIYEYSYDLFCAVESYCKQIPAIANKLYKYILLNPFENDFQWKAAALSGLNQYNYDDFWPTLSIMIQSKDQQNLAFRIVSRAYIITDQQAVQYIHLSKSFIQNDDEGLCQLIAVIQRVLSFSEILELSTIQHCYNSLIDFAKSTSSLVQGAVASTIWSLRGSSINKFEVFVELLRNSSLAETIHTGKTNLIDTILSSFAENESQWFEAFDILAVNKAIRFTDENFHHSIHQLVIRFKTLIPKQVILRLIHKQGAIRQDARRILEFIRSNASHLRFTSEDLLSLNSLQHYRLWLIINDTPYDPEFTIPLLLPLFDSEDELLIELLICQLELASENYMGAILKTLNEVLKPNNTTHQIVKSRVENHFNSFLSYREAKCNINELNPLLCQNELFNQFDTLRRMSWSDKMHQNIRENSLMGLFSEVLLSKGGGWRNSKTGTVSQLGNFESKIRLPRLYFLQSYQMDIEALSNIEGADWDDNIDLQTWITAE